MKIVNVLISVCLLSCDFTCNLASEIGNRNQRLNENEWKQPKDNIELSGQLETLKLIFSERKKNRTTTYSAPQTNFMEATVYPAEYAASMAKNNKKPGTKKPTTTRYEGTTKKYKKNGSKDIDTSNNRWKKIQNFFFHPSTSWPFTKSYKSMEQTTIETRWYIEYLKPDQSKEKGQEVDGTTVIVRTYIHPIPDDKRFYGKEQRILVKEEIIKNKKPDWDNIDINEKAHQEPVNKASTDKNDPEVDRSAKEHLDKLVQIEMPKQQLHLKESMMTTVGPQENILSREWIIQEEKLPSGHKVIEYERFPSRHEIILNEKLPSIHVLIENQKLPSKTVVIENGKLPNIPKVIENEKLPNSLKVIENEKLPSGNELLQNEKLPSGNELLQNEKLPSRYELIQNEKSTTRHEVIENEKLPSRHEIIEKEKLSSRHEENKKLPLGYEVIENDKLPSGYEEMENDKLPSTYEAEIITTEENIIQQQLIMTTNENVNPSGDNNPTAVLNLGTINTLTAEEPIPESAEIDLLNFDQEVSKGIKENDEAPTPEENPEVSLKPESIMELEQIRTPQSRINQIGNFGMIQNNWQDKNMASQKQFNYPEINYFNNEKNQFTEEIVPTKASSNSYIDSPPKESNRDVNEYPNKITNDSKLFLNVFNNFLKNNFPDILNQDVDPLYSKISDKYDLYMTSTNTSLNNSNTTRKMDFFQNKINWQNTEPNPTSNVDIILSFDQPAYHYLTSKDVNGFIIKNKHNNQFEERYFKNESPTKMSKERDRQTDPSLNRFEHTSNISANQYNLKNYSPYQNKFMYPLFYHHDVISTMMNTDDSTERSNWEGPMQNVKAAFTIEDGTISPLAEYTPLQFISNSPINPLLLNNFWNMKKFDFQPNQDIFISTTLTTNGRELYNDNIDYENRHEFNSDHHFTSITEEALPNNTENNLLKDLIPLNFPFSRNKVNINTSHLQRDDLTKEITKSMGYFNILNKHVFDITPDILPEKKVTIGPYNLDFSIEHLCSGVLPIKKAENLPQTFEEPTGNNEKPDIDYIRKQMKDAISLNKWGRKWETPHANSMSYDLRKESLDLQHYPKSHEMKSPLFGRIFFNKNANDTGRKPLLKNLSKFQIKTSKNNLTDEKMASDKSILFQFSSNVTENDLVNMYKSSVDHINTIQSIQTVDPYTRFYNNLNVEKGGGYSLLSKTPWPIMPFENTNIDESLRNPGNFTAYSNRKINSDKLEAGKYLTDTTTKIINDKYVHNYQNEKFLATETGAYNQNFAPSTNPDFYVNNLKKTIPLNSDNFLGQLINQTLPQSFNQSKNEISAVQMSLVKIVNKIPEMLEHNQQKLATDLFVPFQQMFSKDSNNKEANKKMLAPFLSKIPNVLNKLVAENKKRQRDVKGMADNMQTFSHKNNKGAIIQYEIPAKSLISGVRCHQSKAEIIHDFTETSPQAFNSAIKRDNVFSNVRHYKMSGEWKENMQSVINKQNKKRNSQHDFYDNAVQEDPCRLSSYAINNNLQHLEIPHKLLEKFLVEEEYVKKRRGLDNKQSKILFTDNNTKKIAQRNILGSKKMKSRELEFILEKNLPALPLNKAQFISYMMTGRKQAGHDLASEDDKNAHLSKSNLQSFIDRNAKKQFMSADTSNKRTRKKDWQNKL